MSRVVTIDGTPVDVESRIIKHFRKDDELETTEIILKETTQLEPYDMGLRVTITTDGTSEYFIIGNDIITKSSPSTYNHNITLLEAYKIFEREVLASLQFTQELNGTTYTCLDVIDRALKLINIEKTSALGGTRQYDISGIGTRDSNDNYVVGNLTGFALRLYNKKAPEMQFNTPSLREIVDEVFLLFDGRPILENYTTINIKPYNNKNNAIVLSTVDEISGSQNIDKNAQTFDIYMENAVSENNVNKQARVYPSSDAWGSVRSNEATLTDANFLMEVNEDIERVLEFKIYVDVTINYSQRQPSGTTLAKSFSGIIAIDATDYLFTKRAWDALLYNFVIEDTDNATDTWFNSGPNKNNTLYFSGNQILGWHEDVDVWTLFGVAKQWQLFIATQAYLGGYLTLDDPSYWVEEIFLATGNKPEFATNQRDFMFRLKYVPKEVVRVQLDRDTDDGYGVLRANQSARIVDTELLGNNMQSKLNRDGEKELVFSRLNNPFNIDDYYLNYRGTKLDETHYENGDILSTLTLSRNYAKKSERIDLPNRPRQTQISEQNTVRNDIINEYVKVSLSDISASGGLKEAGLDRYMVTLNDTFTPTLPVEFITWENNVLLECTSQGIGKTMSFKFEFPNNISAGTQTVLLDTIYGNKEVVYTTNGVQTNADIKFYDGFQSAISSYAGRAAVAQKLPEYEEGITTGKITLGNLIIDLDERRILKDSGEVYALSYQLINYTTDEELFIGNKLAQNNALVVKDTEDLYLYRTSDYFPRGQIIDVNATFVSKQKIVTGTPASASEVKLVATTLGFGDSKRIKNQFTTNFNAASQWAICNESGEVYIMCNAINEPIFYIAAQQNKD